MITAAADGSSLGNPGPTGWCWYVDEERWGAGGSRRGTNNVGELTAVAELLDATAAAGLAAEPLRILCDSKYVIDSVTKWMPGWKRKGWKKADGKPVLNRELMERIDAAMTGRDVAFEWVKGHAGHRENEAADERARAAATAYQRGREPDAGPGYAGGAGAAVDGTRGRATRVAELPVSALTRDEAEDAADVVPAGGSPAMARGAAPTRESSPGETRSTVLAHERNPQPEPSDDGLLFGDGWGDEWDDGRASATDLDERDGSAEEEVVALERELLTDACRSNPGRLDELLHAGFEELGASGRVLDRAMALADIAPVPGLEARGFLARALAPNVQLVRFETSDECGVALRASVWVNERLAQNERAWQLRWHQATPVQGGGTS